MQAQPLLQSGLLTSPSGLVWALAILFTIRLSRQHTERAAFSSRRQDASEEALINDQQLFRQRQAYEQQAALARQAEAEDRLAKAREQAAQKEAQRATRERQRVEEAAAEKQRREAAAAKQRAAFEAEEARSAAQLRERTEAAQRERKAQERLLQQQREQARREEAERQRQRDAERAAAVAEDERRRAEARAAKEAERRALAALARTYALRLEGAAGIAPPPPGAMTDERVPQEALVQTSVSLGSAVGGEPQQQAALYASLDDARAGAVALSGAAARSATEAFASAVRLQQMMNQGPLEQMDEVELQHWMHVAALRAIATAQQALHLLLNGSATRVAVISTPLQVRTERGVLPADHPQRISSRLDNAIAAVEAGRAADAESILMGVIEDEEPSLLAGVEAPVPEHAAAALVLAHFLDRMLAQRPAKQAEAPAWFEAAAALVRGRLAELTRGAAQDSLTPLAEVAGAALSEAHPVAGVLRDLAEANMSRAARAARWERRSLLEARLAAALVEEEWPDESQLAAQRAAAREAATPVPERVWALRNVAATSALSGPAGAARAAQLLDKALALKQEWVGGAQHPGLLPELEALAGALEAAGEEWQAQEVETRERALRILSFVAARYRAAGHPASAVALLEAAVREHEQRLGLRHRGVAALTRRSEEWFEQLPPKLRLEVADARRDSSLVKTVVAAFAEDLVAAQGAGTQRYTKAELWNQGGLGPLSPLVHD